MKIEITPTNVYTGGTSAEIDGKLVTTSVILTAFDDDGNRVEVRLTRKQAALVAGQFASSLA